MTTSPSGPGAASAAPGAVPGTTASGTVTHTPAGNSVDIAADISAEISTDSVLETGLAGDGLDLEAAQAVLGVDDSRFRHDYLEVRGLRVEFDGFVAVQGVDLTVTAGDLRFLIGPNGAGKTTIVDAITGLAKASGSVQFGGTELLGKKTHRIARVGVGRTFQTASVFEELSVLQNLDIAAGARRGPLTLLRRRTSTPEAVEQALETVGLAHLRDVQAGILAHGQKQWLEIGMLLVQDARLLLLDEPVAGMSQAEREQTGELLQRIGAQRTVVVVEHDMEFLRAYASSVTVLHLGQVLAEGTYAEVQADPRVQEVYLGSAGATRGARRAGRGVAPDEERPGGSERGESTTDRTGRAPGTNDEEA